MTEKMAVVAPMPRASVAMAAAANPGERRRPRRAYFTSCKKDSMFSVTLRPVKGSATPRSDARAALKRKLPGLRLLGIAEHAGRLRPHDAKARLLVDRPRRVQLGVRPECDLRVPGRPGEGHALLHEPPADAEAAG